MKQDETRTKEGEENPQWDSENSMKVSYLTLQDKLFPSFDPQQDALFVLDLRLLHSHDLLHGQQVLLEGGKTN